MLNKKNITDKEIIKLAKGFVRGLLNKSSTVDKCYMVCFPLSAYLNFCGIENMLTEGEVNEFHHFWITLKDGRIVDPTADQFDLPNIYLQPPNARYKPYKAKDYDDKIKEVLVKFKTSYP